MDDKAYRDGRDAFHSGLELSDNPHPALSGDWHDWERGWVDAQDDDLGWGD